MRKGRAWIPIVLVLAATSTADAQQPAPFALDAPLLALRLQSTRGLTDAAVRTAVQQAWPAIQACDRTGTGTRTTMRTSLDVAWSGRATTVRLAAGLDLYASPFLTCARAELARLHLPAGTSGSFRVALARYADAGSSAAMRRDASGPPGPARLPPQPTARRSRAVDQSRAPLTPPADDVRDVLQCWELYLFRNPGIESGTVSLSVERRGTEMHTTAEAHIEDVESPQYDLALCLEESADRWAWSATSPRSVALLSYELSAR